MGVIEFRTQCLLGLINLRVVRARARMNEIISRIQLVLSAIVPTRTRQQMLSCFVNKTEINNLSPRRSLVSTF